MSDILPLKGRSTIHEQRTALGSLVVVAQTAAAGYRRAFDHVRHSAFEGTVPGAAGREKGPSDDDDDDDDDGGAGNADYEDGDL